MSALFALQVASVLLFTLFGASTLLGIRIFGGAKSGYWFAGANLLHAFAILLFVLAVPQPGWLPVKTILFLASFAALHRSFAELLERPKLLWWAQLSMVGVGTCLLIVGQRYAGAAVADVVVGSLAAAAQLALTASIVFSFLGQEAKAAGRFVGAALLVYATLHVLRAEAGIRLLFVHPDASLGRATFLCVLGGLVAGGAVAFGFGFLSSSKQRVELLWRAQIDELTGLLNRWAFKRIAVKETFRTRRNGGNLSVLTMDLDGMKRVNDKLGHSCGDAVLQSVAGALQETLRERDSVARMGGDEFCILLPDTDLAEGVTVAERLRAEIAALTVRYRGETVSVRASFGVSCTQQCGWVWQTLVDRSDAALYEAKRGGNERVIAAQKVVELSAPELPTQAGPERRRKH